MKLISCVYSRVVKKKSYLLKFTAVNGTIHVIEY